MMPLILATSAASTGFRIGGQLAGMCLQFAQHLYRVDNYFVPAGCDGSGKIAGPEQISGFDSIFFAIFPTLGLFFFR